MRSSIFFRGAIARGARFTSPLINRPSIITTRRFCSTTQPPLPPPPVNPQDPKRPKDENPADSNQQQAEPKTPFWKTREFGLIVATLVACGLYETINSRPIARAADSPSPLSSPNPNNAITATTTTPVTNLTTTPTKKPKVLILGTGWAALSMVREIDSSKYDVVVVSPRNYFLFTPMLASATVGTVELRSIIEPIRRFCYRAGATIEYYEAEATNIDYDRCKVQCRGVGKGTVNNKNSMSKSGVDLSGNIVRAVTRVLPFGKDPIPETSDSKVYISAQVGPDGVDHFELDYDYLVVAVGATSATMGVKGVEQHCMSLKEVWDAKAIKAKLLDCFERAGFPGQPDSERKRLLHFVICGGGPTGVEFSAELHDYITGDLRKVYPNLIPDVSITVIQSAGHILNTYDCKVSEYAEEQFKRENIEVKANARVMEVKEKEVVIVDKTKNQQSNVPYGLCIWSAGIGQRPLVQQLSKKLLHQDHATALVTDEYLRVNGVPKKNVFAAGDCATVNQPHMIAHMTDLFKKFDANGDGVISLEELQELVRRSLPYYPHLRPYCTGVSMLFEEFDANRNGVLELDEFQAMLTMIDQHVKSLPTTAQCAGQQGKYLGQMLNSIANESSSTTKQDPTLPSDPLPFEYRHLGSLAYVGGERAVVDSGKLTGGGFGQWFVWRAAYLSKQFSWRNRVLVSFDWVKTFIFGRDISPI